VGDGTKLVVISAGEDAADENLIGAHLTFGGPVDVHDVVINLLRDNGCRVFGSVGSQDKHKVPLDLSAQI
jgi:hypothetical protein